MLSGFTQLNPENGKDTRRRRDTYELDVSMAGRCQPRSAAGKWVKTNGRDLAAQILSPTP